MKVLLMILHTTFALSLSAKLLTSPIDAMKNTFGLHTVISKKNMLLTRQQSEVLSKLSHTNLDTKIFRVFTAKEGKNILGHGILINKKVRSKNGVILYMISNTGILKSIEIIAFNEPVEYIPAQGWQNQFQEIPSTTMPRLSKEISTLTGATLSAKSITDGSRIAFAFYNIHLKEN